jgi:hypothetical protein
MLSSFSQVSLLEILYLHEWILIISQVASSLFVLKDPLNASQTCFPNSQSDPHNTYHYDILVNIRNNASYITLTNPDARTIFPKNRLRRRGPSTWPMIFNKNHAMSGLSYSHHIDHPGAALHIQKILICP